MCLESARVPRAGFGVTPKRTFLDVVIRVPNLISQEKSAMARTPSLACEMHPLRHSLRSWSRARSWARSGCWSRSWGHRGRWSRSRCWRCCGRRGRCWRGRTRRATTIHIEHEVHVGKPRSPNGVGLNTPQSKSAPIARSQGQDSNL